MTKDFKEVIHILQTDTRAIAQFLSSPNNFISQFNLSDDEIAALNARDLSKFNNLGLTQAEAVGALSGAHSQRCGNKML